MPEVYLNVADIQLRSAVNGPGTRTVVWVQGCTRRCTGCFNPHTHPHTRRILLSPKMLANRLAELPGVDGLTLSGGEPFEQAHACAALARTYRCSGRSVMVFTGYPLPQLQLSSDPHVMRLLAAIDLVVAGPYVEARRIRGDRWRASSNQRFCVLTERGREAMAAGCATRAIAEVTTDGSTIATTGFPSREDRLWIQRLATAIPPRNRLPNPSVK